jgi:hypothetical protein
MIASYRAVLESAVGRIVGVVPCAFATRMEQAWASEETLHPS